jgi:hypothetical protein
MKHRISILALLVLLPWSGFVAASERQALLQRYQTFKSLVSPIIDSVPLRIRSARHGDGVSVEVFGLVDQSFSRVTDALSSPTSFCDFLLLNLNVKACTHEPRDSHSALKIYVAGKSYSPPYRSLTIEPIHQVKKRGRDYFSMYLTAQKGFFGTSDYLVVVQAIPYGGKTMVRIASSYHGSAVTRAATHAYLRTFARNKIGFTIVGEDGNGRPQYVKGLQAVIERNVVRSYLALQAHLDTTESGPSPGNFDRRIRRWYDLTDYHALQLREIGRDRYVRNKRREYRNQIRLQARVEHRLKLANDTSLPIPASSKGFNAVAATE